VLIGITGGMGSGKSTFARFLEKRGAALVDADQLGHQVLEIPSVVAELVAAFGPKIAGQGGRIVRRELGQLAFATSEGLATLNRIVRPYLEALLWEEADRLAAPKGEGKVVVDAALIFEWGVEDRFDLVVVVDAPEPLRCQRAAARQGLSEEEVRGRLAWQLPAATKTARADLVVPNEGTLAALEERAEELWRCLTAGKSGVRAGGGH